LPRQSLGAQVQVVKETAAKVDVRAARQLAGRAVSSARSVVDGCGNARGSAETS